VWDGMSELSRHEHVARCRRLATRLHKVKPSLGGEACWEWLHNVSTVGAYASRGARCCPSTTRLRKLHSSVCRQVLMNQQVLELNGSAHCLPGTRSSEISNAVG
jgi:hypothetical protein